MCAWACMLGATQAQTPVQLEVTTDDVFGCLTEAGLRAELDRRYARPTVASPTSDIVVRVESAGAGEAIVRFARGGTELGTRHFTELPLQCDAQRAVISVAILVALDEITDRAPTEQPEGSSTKTKSEAPIAPPPSVPSQPSLEALAEPVPSRRPWQLSMSLALERGLVPGWALGGRARLATQLPRGLTLRMEGWGAGSKSLQVGDRSVRVRLVALGPGICVSFRNAAVALPMCMGVLAGIALAQGDPDQPEGRATRLPWSAATLHGSVRLLPRLIVGPILSVDTFVHLARPRLTAQDESGATIASRSWPRGGASLSLGAEVRLR